MAQHVNRDTGEIGASAPAREHARQADEMSVAAIGFEDEARARFARQRSSGNAAAAAPFVGAAPRF
jgi:hypothetical protein